MYIHHRVAEAAVLITEPGDGTHYEFTVVMPTAGHDDGWLYIAGMPSMELYQYRVDAILEAYHRIRKHEARDAITDHFVRYVAEVGHGSCNPFTARAMVLAVGRWLEGDDYDE